MVALQERASKGLQSVQIVSGLDPFGDNLEAEGNAEVENGLYHHAFVPGPGQTGDKAPIDLDPTGMELAK